MPFLVREITQDEGLTVFRVVRGGTQAAPSFVDNFRSHYELQRPPRRIENRSAAIHMGVSMWATLSRAEGTAQRWPVIGDHVAQLRLFPGNGFNYAETGNLPGHLTVWGDPVKLVESVVDIVPVREAEA